MNCKHCNRPLRKRRGPHVDGTFEDAGGGYCHTCRSHLRNHHGEFQDGWWPGNKGGDRLGPVERQAVVEARLDDYAELRGRRFTRRQCADRMGISMNTLQRFLARHCDDPRSDAHRVSENVPAGHNVATRSLDIDAETRRLAQLTVCARLGVSEARMVLAMLGIAS